MLYEGSRDLTLAFLAIGFQDETQVLDTAKSTAMPKYLSIFDEVNTGSFLVSVHAVFLIY